MSTRGAAIRQPSRHRAPGASHQAAEARRGSSAEERRPASLGVVDRRQLLERARRRQARVLFFLSGSILAAALALAAAGHALLASEQVRADGLQAKVAASLATEQNRLLERAELETPSRVLAIATQRFKMVTPSHVTYLQPVNPGPSVEAVHGGDAARSRGSGGHSAAGSVTAKRSSTTHHSSR